MKGHEQIIEARMRGYRPTGLVFLDVGQSVRWQSFLTDTKSTMLNEAAPLHPHVCLAPNESARTADWSWCLHLKIQVDGDDKVRVMAAYERILNAGADRVLATCGGSLLIDSADSATEN